MRFVCLLSHTDSLQRIVVRFEFFDLEVVNFNTRKMAENTVNGSTAGRMYFNQAFEIIILGYQ